METPLWVQDNFSLFGVFTNLNSIFNKVSCDDCIIVSGWLCIKTPV